MLSSRFSHLSRKVRLKWRGTRGAQVIVENEVVGSQILEHGKLQQRVTLLPLNKIKGVVAVAEVRFNFLFELLRR